MSLMPAADLALAKKQRIHGLDLADGDPLANAPADPSLLYSLQELATLLKPLMGIDAPRDGDNRILEVRPKGHWFEFEVAKALGYHYPPGAGLFPDLRNQLLEVKHHRGKSVTIDFGHHRPGAVKVLDARWNEKARARVCDIRYLIALAPPPSFRVTVMVLATGAEIDSIFGVSPTQTIRYQLGISKRWREEHAGQILASGKPFAG
ncbi:MAG: hypothetical protein NTW86_30125 [Candidatus Sumerlaeota bacterium]|nr:hypothetical protein [Candidatus Sumerlaeota bacterium]